MLNITPCFAASSIWYEDIQDLYYINNYYFIYKSSTSNIEYWAVTAKSSHGYTTYVSSDSGRLFINSYTDYYLYKYEAASGWTECCHESSYSTSGYADVLLAGKAEGLDVNDLKVAPLYDKEKNPIPAKADYINETTKSGADATTSTTTSDSDSTHLELYGKGSETYTIVVPINIQAGTDSSIVTSGTWQADKTLKVQIPDTITFTRGSFNFTETSKFYADADDNTGSNEITRTGDDVSELAAESKIIRVTKTNAANVFGDWTSALSYTVSLE